MAKNRSNGFEPPDSGRQRCPDRNFESQLFNRLSQRSKDRDSYTETATNDAGLLGDSKKKLEAYRNKLKSIRHNSQTASAERPDNFNSQQEPMSEFLSKQQSTNDLQRGSTKTHVESPTILQARDHKFTSQVKKRNRRTLSYACDGEFPNNLPQNFPQNSRAMLSLFRSKHDLPTNGGPIDSHPTIFDKCFAGKLAEDNFDRCKVDEV
jgi:hypothetical protein